MKTIGLKLMFELWFGYLICWNFYASLCCWFVTIFFNWVSLYVLVVFSCRQFFCSFALKNFHTLNRIFVEISHFFVAFVCCGPGRCPKWIFSFGFSCVTEPWKTSFGKQTIQWSKRTTSQQPIRHAASQSDNQPPSAGDKKWRVTKNVLLFLSVCCRCCCCCW